MQGGVLSTLLFQCIRITSGGVPGGRVLPSPSPLRLSPRRGPSVTGLRVVVVGGGGGGAGSGAAVGAPPAVGGRQAVPVRVRSRLLPPPAPAAPPDGEARPAGDSQAERPPLGRRLAAAAAAAGTVRVQGAREAPRPAAHTQVGTATCRLSAVSASQDSVRNSASPPDRDK